MFQARVIADHVLTVAQIDRRIFGAFVEHMGRCVYGGIYEPGHETADEDGFRGDVLALTRELGPIIIRYPGGNFLSGYNWEDGVGPKDQRSHRLELAWFSTETNQFGINEFIQWARKAEIEPMLGVNFGTRGVDEARQYLEYCNYPGGTELSDRRHADGFAEPHNVEVWCLGNEMDGRWQIGAKTAYEYDRLAHETAKVMRWIDPKVQLAACGSSHRGMPTFGEWEYTVLEECFEVVDYISLHTYFTNPLNSTPEYLGNLELMDIFIREVVAICDAVAAKKRSFKRIMLSFDEWNVWYRKRGHAYQHKPGWPEAPELIEEVYNMQDALVVGGALIVLLNNADRVRIACLAQLVNVIGPIMTETGGPAWRQTIFHPFAQASQHAHGRVLKTFVESPLYTALSVAQITYLLSAVTVDDATGRISIFALNRHLTDDMELDVQLNGFEVGKVEVASQLRHDDLLATNTRDAPDTVTPTELTDVHVAEGRVRVTLKPASWNVIVVA